ncbi:MAG: glycosyltransferase family 2 protein [Clostridia bacterium]|nr:glycosyltransferase family 2 protein [Clostridia bacterium]
MPEVIVLRILDIISAVLGVIMGAYGLFYAVIAVFGFKKRKSDFEKTAPSMRIAAIIAARNEEGVIGQVVESLVKQNYPKALFDVIVVPNNCSDDTAGAAQRAGARIVNVDVPVKSKGEALKSAFRQIMEKDTYDAFAIFDADNIVHPGFLQAANDALSGGARIAQGYRDSKNPYDNWVSGCSSIFYWFMNRMFNHGRRVLKQSAQLNGTGFIVATSLLKETGFDTHTITEDLEYTAQCILHGERVRWMDDAITYDEQPESLLDALTQRKRWFGGAWQCKKYYFKDLLKLRSFGGYDMALIFGSIYFMILGSVPIFTSVISMLIYALDEPLWALALILTAALSGIGSVIAMMGFAAFVCILEKKNVRKMWKGIITFPLFMALWMLANWSCILMGPPKWKPIKHKAVEKFEADKM